MFVIPVRSSFLACFLFIFCYFLLDFFVVIFHIFLALNGVYSVLLLYHYQTSHFWLTLMQMATKCMDIFSRRFPTFQSQTYVTLVIFRCSDAVIIRCQCMSFRYCVIIEMTFCDNELIYVVHSIILIAWLVM